MSKFKKIKLNNNPKKVFRDSRRMYDQKKYEVLCTSCNRTIIVAEGISKKHALRGHLAANCHPNTSSLYNTYDLLDNKMIEYPRSPTELREIIQGNYVSNDDEYYDVHDDIDSPHHDELYHDINTTNQNDEPYDKYYKFQEYIYDRLLRIRSFGRQKNKVLSFKSDEYLIYKFTTDLKLSNREGNKFLELLHTISSRRGLLLRDLPKSIETISEHFHNTIKNDEYPCSSYLKSFKYRLDKNFFPLLNDKTTDGYFYDILEIISESLLTIDPTNFVINPDCYRTVDIGGVKERLFEDFTTGDYFKDATDAVRKHSGNPNAVFLAIGITCDETIVRSGSISETPVCIYILNCINNAFRMHLVGYIPNALPYTELEVIEAYPNLQIGIRKKILEMLNRNMRLEYISEILKPLLDYSDTGLKLRIGVPTSTNSTVITAFPHVSMITADSKECTNLSGVSYSSKYCKCRICLKRDCISVKTEIDLETNFRDDNISRQLSLDGYTAMVNQVNKGGRMTDDIQKVYDTLKQVNLKAGKNPLYDIFKWQNDHKLISFHKALVPDYLHTIIKGLIETGISMTMASMFAIQDIDKQYKNNIKYIDDRIKRFPSIQSFEFLRRHRFLKGLSQLFYKTWGSSSKNSNKGTGFISGKVEAWKLPILLFQLMFCINKDIVPFDKNWSSNFSTKWKWNPGVTILNALTSLFDMHIFCSKTILSIKDVDVTLNKLISNCHAQQSLLWLMRKDLVESASKSPVLSGNNTKQQIAKLSNLKSENFWNAVKPHLSTHIPFYKKLYGVDKRAYDTELSEKSHIKFVKDVYEKSNKKTYDSQKQMLVYIRNSESLVMAENVLDSSLSIIENDVNSSTTTSTSYTMKNSSYSIRHSYGYENVSMLNHQLIFTSCKGQRNKTFSCESLNTTLVSIEEFSNLCKSNFADIDKDDLFISEWDKVVMQNKPFRFLKSVEVSESPDNKFGIVADNSYKHFQNSSLQSSVFNFVEVKWEYEESNNNLVTGTSIVQVISIINFESNNDENVKLYLLVVWMQTIPTTNSTNNIFPNFEKYGYDIIQSSNRRTKKLNMSIISINTVIRPAFLIQYSDIGNYWSYDHIKVTIKLNDLIQYRFYSIPFLYAKRDSLSYENSYQHWRYRNDNISSNLPNPVSSLGSSSSSSSSSSSGRSNNAGGFDISEKVYGAFLNEVEINEVDSYLKKRFSTSFKDTQADVINENIWQSEEEDSQNSNGNNYEEDSDF